MGVVEAAEAVADGSTTAEALATLSLDRLERIGPRYNAVVALDSEFALEQARSVDAARKSGKALGPLAGVPLAHKDLIYRANRRCTGGSIIRRDFVPGSTATVLRRLDDAGALDLGSLKLAEFALSPTGLNVHHGHGRNPWNVDYCPGGSSSGSGAAVAARLVCASMGSDTGGSIRHPAAMCGITGLKPTHGLVSMHGAMPLAPSLDTIGPLARSAKDVARLLSVIAGPDILDGATRHQPEDYESALTGELAGLTVAVPDDYFREQADPGILKVIDDSLQVFKAAGARLVRTTVPDMGLVNALMQLVMGAEAATLHLRWLKDRPQDYGDQVRSRIVPGLAYPATRYIEAMMLRGKLAREWIETAMCNADFVHLPTLSSPVPSILETTLGSAEEVAASLARVTRCTRGINYLGLPAIAVPCGFSEGDLPVSFQLVGRPYAEGTLLRAADAYQRLTDFHMRLPADSGAFERSSATTG